MNLVTSDKTVTTGVWRDLPLDKALVYTTFMAGDFAQARSFVRTAPRGS